MVAMRRESDNVAQIFGCVFYDHMDELKPNDCVYFPFREQDETFQGLCVFKYLTY